MGQEATIKINLEGGNANKTLKDLKEEVKSVGKEVDKTSDKFKETDKGLSDLANTLEDFGNKGGTAINLILDGAEPLTGQLGKLKDAMTLLDPQSSEFVELAQKASELERKIKNVDSAVSALSSESKSLDGLIGAGQAIGGAFQASQGAMALFGAESEKVDKAIKNVIAVQGIMNGVMVVRNALDKEAIAGMYLRTAVTKIATATTRAFNYAMKETIIGQKLQAVWTAIVTSAQWLWNVAVSANPIGLIVIGVAALIAGIVLLVMNIDKVIKFFKNWTNVLFLMLGPLGWLILAYRALKEETDELESARVKQNKAENSRHAEQLRNIDKLRKEEAKAHKDKITAVDLEIDRLEAEGKSSFALKLQRLKDIRDEEQAILDSNNEKLQSWIEHYQNLARIQGQSDEQFKESLKAQGIDLDSLLDQVLKNQEKQKQAIFSANTDIIALEREHAKKSNKVSKKSSDDKVKNKEKETEKLRLAEEKAFNNFLLAKDKAEKEFLDSQLSAEQREINAVADKYSKLIDLAIGYGEDTAILEEAREQNLFDIRRKFEEEEAQAKLDAELLREEQAKAIVDKRLADIDKVADHANQILSIASDLQSIANAGEIKRIKEKQKAGEQLSRAEMKRLINDEKQKRAIAIAEIAIQTAVGIAKAVTAGAGLPFPANIPAIIAGVSAVLSGVASATKILNAPLPTFDSPTAGDADGTLGGGASENAPNINPNQNGSTLLNPEPTKVFVVESDITNVQSNINAIVEEATV